MATYYLKCEHCGHLNEMKTSYLVFCEQCGKKMKNNFSNWKLINTGKTLEDFQKEVCISEEKLTQIEASKPRQRKRVSNKQWIGIIIGVSIVIIIGYGTAFVVEEFLFPNLEKYKDAKWTTQTCGKLGLKIDAPIKLESSTMIDDQLPDEVKDFIITMETCQSSVMNRKLFIMTNTVRYKPDINVSLNGAIQGSIEEMKKKPEVSDFQQDISPVRLGEVQGGLVSGKYKEGNNLYGYRMVIYVKGSVMWQVLVGYDYKDKFGYEISERIIKSISITPNIAGIELLNRNLVFH